MKHRITTTAALFVAAITFSLPLTALSTELPVCTYAQSDSDGDGFGWEDRRSCRVTEDSQTDGSEKLFGCIDNDGDGWAGMVWRYVLSRAKIAKIPTPLEMDGAGTVKSPARLPPTLRALAR